VVRLYDASRIITINKNIELRNLDQVLPYKYAKDIILKNPQNIDSNEYNEDMNLKLILEKIFHRQRLIQTSFKSDRLINTVIQDLQLMHKILFPRKDMIST